MAGGEEGSRDLTGGGNGTSYSVISVACRGLGEGGAEYAYVVIEGGGGACAVVEQRELILGANRELSDAVDHVAVECRPIVALFNKMPKGRAGH